MPVLPIAVSLISTLLPDLLKLFGKDKQAEVAEKVVAIAQKVSGKEDPNEAAAETLKDPALAIQFKEAILAQQLELERIGLQRETLYVNDTQDARKYRDDKVFRLGVIILTSFAIVMGITLYGLYKMTVGTVPVDQSIFAAVVGLVGAIIGYFAANAQQVVSYFFGSSQGSMVKSDNIADATKALKLK